MGTKNNPGPYDAYAKADPDEPLFTLIGRDKFASSLVELWAAARESTGESREVVTEAFDCSAAMKQHIYSLRKRTVQVLDFVPFELLASALRRRGATVTPAPAEPPAEAATTAPEAA